MIWENNGNRLESFLHPPKSIGIPKLGLVAEQGFTLESNLISNHDAFSC